jgi:hypothetical protein
MKAKIDTDGNLCVMWNGKWIEQNCVRFEDGIGCSIECPALHFDGNKRIFLNCLHHQVGYELEFYEYETNDPKKERIIYPDNYDKEGK